MNEWLTKNSFRCSTQEPISCGLCIQVPALRYICDTHGIPLSILFAGNDHWSPEFHIHDLLRLQDRGVLSRNNIRLRYMPQIKHDFVTSQVQTNLVLDFCVDWIRSHPKQALDAPRSKL